MSAAVIRRSATTGISGWVWRLCSAGLSGLLSSTGSRIFAGKRNALIITACIGIVAYAGSWYLYNPAYPVAANQSPGLMGLTASGLWMLYGSICADVIDYDELNTGKRREGSFTSCGTYILKLGSALGGLLAGYIISSVGGNAALQAGAPETILLDSHHACRHVPLSG
jgi:GPH family glycoside/pentoside/hexuronide:cation symporter